MYIDLWYYLLKHEIRMNWQNLIGKPSNDKKIIVTLLWLDCKNNIKELKIKNKRFKVF